jgi:hypothetical protein
VILYFLLKSILYYSVLKLFTFVDHLYFVMELRVSNKISQYAIISSYILLFDSENTLFIHSISRTPKLVFKTTEFQHNLIKVHSFTSFFYIIDGSTGQIFQIDTKLPFKQHTIAHLKFKCQSLLNTIGSE